MLRRIQLAIREYGRLPPGAHLVAGVSGGADSTAMLYALWFLAPRLRFSLSAAHLHHGLRGRSADRDTAFVELLCARLGIPLDVRRQDVPARARGEGVSFEMAARSARHEFFRDVIAARGAAAVVLAHTRDDQAETVLMRILSGTGIEGLAGIAHRSEPAQGVVVIRPLLDIGRHEIEGFLRSHHIAWRDDPSNREHSYLRNRIRHVILPFLRAQGFPRAASALTRLADIAAHENALVERAVEAVLASCRAGDGRQLDAACLAAHPLAEQRRVIRRWLMQQGRARELDLPTVDRVVALLRKPDRAAVQVDARRRVSRVSGKLVCRDAEMVCQGGDMPEIPLKVPGRTVLTGAGLVVTVSKARGYRKEPAALDRFPVTGFIRRTSRAPALSVRARRPGDAIRPTGLDGRVSLKELFIDRKVPVNRRGRIPLVVCGGTIVWVAGYRIAADWAVSSRQAPSWKIVIERTGSPPVQP